MNEALVIFFKVHWLTSFIFKQNSLRFKFLKRRLDGKAFSCRLVTIATTTKKVLMLQCNAKNKSYFEEKMSFLLFLYSCFRNTKHRGLNHEKYLTLCLCFGSIFFFKVLHLCEPVRCSKSRLVKSPISVPVRNWTKDIFWASVLNKVQFLKNRQKNL